MRKASGMCAAYLSLWLVHMLACVNGFGSRARQPGAE